MCMGWLAVAAAAAAAECDSRDAGVCLLSLRSQRAAGPAEPGPTEALVQTGAQAGAGQGTARTKREWVDRQAELHAWGMQHTELKHALAHVLGPNRQHEAPSIGTFTPAERLDAWHAGNPVSLLDRNRNLLSAGAGTNWLDQFVAAQNANGEACHSKVLEAKRTLDGLSSKVLALSDAIEGHEAVIEGNTQLIRDGMNNKESNDDNKVAEDQQCDDEYAAAIAENQKYRVELDELDQMANPRVRSSIAHDMDIKAEIKAHLEAQNLSIASAARAKIAADPRAITTATTTAGPAALLQAAPVVNLHPEASGAHPALLQSCTQLDQFLRKVSNGHRMISAMENASYVQLDCNATREGLQQEYTAAYEAIQRLFDDGEQLAADNLALCKQAAQDKHQGKDDVIDGKLTHATRAVQGAKDVIETFQPVLDTAKNQVKLLEEHIATLQSTCVVDENVTSHLKKVRMLIESLDKCPGRNDFKLSVPTVTGFLPDSVTSVGAPPP